MSNETKQKKALKVFCKKIAKWLNKTINIPFLPEWLEGLIFNILIKSIVKIIIGSLKKLGGEKR